MLTIHCYVFVRMPDREAVLKKIIIKSWRAVYCRLPTAIPKKKWREKNVVEKKQRLEYKTNFEKRVTLWVRLLLVLHQNARTFVRYI